MWYFATTVEQAMDRAEAAIKGKNSEKRKQQARQSVLDQYLESTREEARGRFRDPATSSRITKGK